MNLNRELINYFTERSAMMPESEGGCYLWQAGATSEGYGAFWRHGKTAYVHRESMRAHGYEIEGLTVDHQCANKNCWNPIHLEMITRQENTRRMALKRWGVYRKMQPYPLSVSA